jgi:hypothetical protein
MSRLGLKKSTLLILKKSTLLILKKSTPLILKMRSLDPEKIDPSDPKSS